MDIKKRLELSGFSMPEFAEKMGITTARAYAILDTPGVKLTTLRKICNVLGCTMLDLFEDEIEGPKPVAQSVSTFTCPHCGMRLKMECSVTSMNEELGVIPTENKPTKC